MDVWFLFWHNVSVSGCVTLICIGWLLRNVWTLMIFDFYWFQLSSVLMKYIEHSPECDYWRPIVLAVRHFGSSVNRISTRWRNTFTPARVVPRLQRNAWTEPKRRLGTWPSMQARWYQVYTQNWRQPWRRQPEIENNLQKKSWICGKQFCNKTMRDNLPITILKFDQAL